MPFIQNMDSFKPFNDMAGNLPMFEMKQPITETELKEKAKIDDRSTFAPTEPAKEEIQSKTDLPAKTEAKPKSESPELVIEIEKSQEIAQVQTDEQKKDI